MAYYSYRVFNELIVILFVAHPGTAYTPPPFAVPAWMVIAGLQHLALIIHGGQEYHCHIRSSSVAETHARSRSGFISSRVALSEQVGVPSPAISSWNAA